MKKVLFVIHFVLLISITIFAKDSTKTISGIVIDKLTGEIISSANIKVTGNRFNAAIESDFAGKFIITDINFGIYKFFITRLGYADFDTNIAINSNIIPYLNLYLTPVELQIEKINVTATKTEQTLQQTPSSISIVSEDDIKNRNIVTFDQMLENIQGITINRSSSINVNSLSIRGSSDVAGGGIGNRVLLLLDGRPSLSGDSKGALWSLIPVSIIEKTEIVKGAFSSLYGSSAIGGVINVITKQPTFKPITIISSNYGFYEKLPDSLRFTNQLLTFKGLDILHCYTIN